ncbi:MAG: hypothetical protein LBR89_03990 [Holosporales bacterium]|jgi:uncharacterized pyridoxamine 5'-phosphate oxidase family protein|nr:hypothetical protein [Holosporales bacterium]
MNFKIAATMLAFSQPFVFGSYLTKFGVHLETDTSREKVFSFIIKTTCQIKYICTVTNEPLLYERSCIYRTAFFFPYKYILENQFSAYAIDRGLRRLSFDKNPQVESMIYERSRIEDVTSSYELKQVLKNTDKALFAFLSNDDDPAIRSDVAVIKEHLRRSLQYIEYINGNVLYKALKQIANVQVCDANFIWTDVLENVFEILDSGGIALEDGQKTELKELLLNEGSLLLTKLEEKIIQDTARFPNIRSQIFASTGSAS